MNKPKKYVRTIRELAEQLGMHEQSLYNPWLKREGFAGLKTAKGLWPVEKCNEFMDEWKSRQVQSVTGVNADLKREKLQEEIGKLRDQRAMLRKEWIPLDEHNAEVDQVAALFTGGLEQFVQWVAAETRDAGQHAKAKEIRDRTRLAMVERVRSA